MIRAKWYTVFNFAQSLMVQKKYKAKTKKD